MVRAPVIFIVFNRPEHASKVFARIRAERPAKLVIVADGPRPDRPGEIEACLKVRQMIEEGVDWPCELVKDYSEVNLGCGRRIALGISRAFTHIEEAIILEDDCLPAPSFFNFCDELLARYRDNPQVAQIGGVNFQSGAQRGDASYYFSRYPHCWGWATWRRAWRDYDGQMHGWQKRREAGWLEEVFRQSKESQYWRAIFDQTAAGLVDTWDYPWTYACWKHDRLSVLPQVNLVSNIGFGEEATHTKRTTQLSELSLQEMCFPLRHPDQIKQHIEADTHTWERVFRPRSTWARVLSYISRIRA